MRSLLFLTFLASTALAVPVNDNFTARIALGNAATVTTTGDNTGATLEAAENDLDSIGGSSIWWKWTAPANAWVRVDTSGSSIDTVLAVLADGPTLADTYIVGTNDESGDATAPAGSSRVIFQATAGTEYHLAVHGFLNAQGPVKLNITSGITPPLRITALSLTPGSVNITAASQTITADIGLASDAPFSEGVLVLHRANFSGLTEVPIANANRISGTTTAGVYRVSFAIPRYSAPGTWIFELALSDTLGREAVYGRGVAAEFEYDHVLPDGLPGLFSVTNTGGIDSVSPTLASFTLSPTTANVSVNPAALSFGFRITDSLSGFGSATLTLFTPTGAALTTIPVTTSHRTVGTALDGTFSVPFTLPAKMPTGTWRATLLIRDATGNPALYDGGTNGLAFPVGSISSLNVTGAAHSYWAWIYPRLTTTPKAQPGDDLDGDGIPNLVEYAFGLTVDDPSGNAALPQHEALSNSLKLTFLRRTDAAQLGLTYTPQFSSNLSIWTDGIGGTVTPVNNDFEQVTISDPASAANARFGRVKVTIPP